MSEYERLYSLGFWPEDPETESGALRVKRLERLWETLFDHPWLEGRENVVDFCSGKGMAGITLAKWLGLKEVTLVDVREEALSYARRWGEREGIKVRVVVDDLTSPSRLEELRGNYDLALMFGTSHGHFSPWDMLKALAYMSESLRGDGVILVEGMDLHYAMFYLGYRSVMANVGDKGPVLTVNMGYNWKRGTFSTYYYNLKTGEESRAEVFYWGPAMVSAFVWAFFKDVDVMPFEGSYVTLGKGVRGKLSLKDLSEDPRVLKPGKAIGR